MEEVINVNATARFKTQKLQLPQDPGGEYASKTDFVKINKWVINLSKKELTPEEKSLLQKGLKFAVTPATIPIKEYISTTTEAALQAGGLNGVDCSGLYHDVNRIWYSYTNKPIHTNITKTGHYHLKVSGKTRTASLLQLTKVWPCF